MNGTTTLGDPVAPAAHEASDELALTVFEIVSGTMLDAADARERIARLESELAKLPQLDAPLRHIFVDGVYARELFIPAGTCAVGKIHKLNHLSTVLGDISVLTAEGERFRIRHGEFFASPAGTKRAVYAHADTWWTTFHPNPSNTRDLAALEAELIVPSFEALAATGLVQPEGQVVS